MVRHLKTSLPLLVCSIAILSSSPAFSKTSAKKLTIEDRQEQLMANINEAQRNNELTAKEARSLRGELADVAHKKAKIKGKKTKLSDEDQQMFETELNDISVALKKKRLDKRVHPEAQAKAREKALESKKAAEEGKAKGRAEELSKAQKKAQKVQEKAKAVEPAKSDSKSK